MKAGAEQLKVSTPPILSFVIEHCDHLSGKVFAKKEARSGRESSRRTRQTRLVHRRITSVPKNPSGHREKHYIPRHQKKSRRLCLYMLNGPGNCMKLDDVRMRAMIHSSMFAEDV